MDLNQEIRYIKRTSFPELKWVFTSGVYVSRSFLEKNNANAAAKVNVCRLFYEDKLLLGIGFARIMIPEELNGYANLYARRGVIAHELSHIVSLPQDECLVDNEVIRRGEGRSLYLAIVALETFGFSRPPNCYNSRALLEKVVK